MLLLLLLLLLLLYSDSIARGDAGWYDNSGSWRGVGDGCTSWWREAWCEKRVPLLPSLLLLPANLRRWRRRGLLWGRL